MQQAGANHNADNYELKNGGSRSSTTQCTTQYDTANQETEISKRKGEGPRPMITEQKQSGALPQKDQSEGVESNEVVNNCKPNKNHGRIDTNPTTDNETVCL